MGQTRRIDTGLDTWIEGVEPDGRASWNRGAVLKPTGKEHWDVSVWFGPECEGIHFRAATREEGVSIITGVHALVTRGPLHEAILAYRRDGA